MFTQQVTFLHTADLAATSAFYEQMLGLPLTLDQGTCRIYRATPSAFVGFCTHLTARRPDERTVILALVTADVDGWYARLVKRGVSFEKPPTRNDRFNIYHCFLRDPNGYLLEIQRFEDPAWPGVNEDRS